MSDETPPVAPVPPRVMRIGDLVHFVMKAGAIGREIVGAIRPAVVVGVNKDAGPHLNVMCDTVEDGEPSLFAVRFAKEDQTGTEPGSWHYPERE